MQAAEQVLVVHQVVRVRVVLPEDLGAKQEQVEAHGIGHQLGHLVDRLVLDLEGRHLAQDLEQDQQQRGSGAERRGDEPRCQDGAVPVRATRHAVVQERRHGMDAHGHRDGEDDQRYHDLLVVGDPVIRAVHQVARHDQVDGEIDVQHDGVPRHDRTRHVHVPNAREDVPEAVRTPHVHQDEEQAHHDRRDGEHLAEQRDFLDRLPVVDVGRDHQQHRGRGDADEEGEVADVEAPRHRIAHVRADQAALVLVRVREERLDDAGDQEKQPRVVHLVPAEERHARGARHEVARLPNEAHDVRLTARSSRRISAACSVLPSGCTRACSR